MSRALKIVAYILFWAAALLLASLAGIRASRQRAARKVEAYRIVVADSARTGMISSATVRDWLRAERIPLSGMPCSEAPLARIEAALLRHSPIREAAAYIAADGTLTVEVTQQRPLMRFRLEGGYDFYLSEQNRIFAPAPGAAFYVPVVTGRFTPPFTPSYRGPAQGMLHERLSELDSLCAKIALEKRPVYQRKELNAKALRRVRRYSAKRGWFEDRENFRARAEALKRMKRDSLHLLRYRARVIAEEIERIDGRIAGVRERQKKLEKNYDDFCKLTNFVKLIEEDDFWRSLIVQIVVGQASDGALTVNLVPRAGDHVVVFGRLCDQREKLDKLLLFYRRGLSREGWEGYRTVDVRFRNQIICSK